MPSNAIQFLSLDEVLVIHQRLIDVFGGPAGIRDMGLLESALFRPQTGYYETIIHMSAALFESLLMNHPFIDGNKRAAFFVTDIFLRLNGYKIKVDSTSAHKFIISLLESKIAHFDSLFEWLESHMTNHKS